MNGGQAAAQYNATAHRFTLVFTEGQDRVRVSLPEAVAQPLAQQVLRALGLPVGAGPGGGGGPAPRPGKRFRDYISESEDQPEPLSPKKTTKGSTTKR